MTSPTAADPSRDSYTIGWIAALPVERAAAEELLDEQYDKPFDFIQPHTDHNSYSWGRIGEHNIVIASLEAGIYGPTAAATTAMSMLSSFPHIRFGLLVGIGGGIPSDSHDIRLGDVVVSQPSGNEGGVVQYDHVKAKAGGVLERKDFLDKPPQILLSALSNLQAKHKRKKFGVPMILKDMQQRNPEMFISESGEPGYEFQGVDNDRLFASGQLVDRPPRLNADVPKIHYGLIASGNTLVKDAVPRQQLLDHLPPNCDCLCYEMEAAGLMNNFPCLVIRGICDYADSHKNDQWQPYASVTAAAFAKEFLGYVPSGELRQSQTALDVVKRLDTIDESLKIFGTRMEDIHTTIDDEKARQERDSVLRWLDSTDHTARFNDYKSPDKCHPGTGKWYLESPQFQDWLTSDTRTLFSPGIPGAGKTIITTIVISHLSEVLNSTTSRMGYLYFSFREREAQTVYKLIASLLKQIALPKSGEEPLPGCVDSLYKTCQQQSLKSPTHSELIDCLIATSEALGKAFMVIDGLDECSEQTREELLLLHKRLSQKHTLKFLFTSRPLPSIQQHFENNMKLEIRAKNIDVGMFLQNKIHVFPSWIRDDEDLVCQIKSSIATAVNGMFLLARLHLDSLRGQQTKGEVEAALLAIKNVPKHSDALKIAYDGALKRIDLQLPNERKWARAWVTHAKRPLFSDEAQHGLAVRSGDERLDHKNYISPVHIVSLCAGLVTISSTKGTIELVHYTTKEYLHAHQGDWIHPAQIQLARSCLAYLSLNARGSKYSNGNVFLDYASRHWASHASLFQEQLKEECRSILRHTETVARSVAVQDSFHFNNVKDWTVLHYSAFFGLDVVFVSYVLDNERVGLMRNGIHWGYSGQTPLDLAAKQGHVNMVKTLLGLGIIRFDPNMRDEFCRTPLFYAIESGQSEIVKAFIDSALETIDLSSAQRAGLIDRSTTPLILAICGRHFEISKLLLDFGPDRVNAHYVDWQSRTALSYAVELGDTLSVRKLLSFDAEKARTHSWAEPRMSIQPPYGPRGRDDTRDWSDQDLAHPSRITNLQSIYGETPLDIAIRKNFRSIAGLLQLHGGKESTVKRSHSPWN